MSLCRFSKMRFKYKNENCSNSEHTFKLTFFKTVYFTMKKKKKVCAKSFFMGTAIAFCLIDFYRVFLLWLMSYSFTKKIFPHIQKTYVDVFFPARSFGTLSFAVQARFSGEKLNFSFLNAEKLKKLIRSKPKKILFNKLKGTLFFDTQKYKVLKKGGFTCVPLILKIDIFWTFIWHTFFEKPTDMYCVYKACSYPMPFWL